MPRPLLDAIEGAEALAVSAISCWELVLLHQRGQVALPLSIADWLREATEGSDVRIVPIDCATARLAGELPEHHRDPADRLIIASAILNHARLATLDQTFAEYLEIRARLLPPA